MSYILQCSGLSLVGDLDILMRHSVVQLDGIISASDKAQGLYVEKLEYMLTLLTFQSSNYCLCLWLWLLMLVFVATVVVFCCLFCFVLWP